MLPIADHLNPNGVTHRIADHPNGVAPTTTDSSIPTALPTSSPSHHLVAEPINPCPPVLVPDLDPWVAGQRDSAGVWVGVDADGARVLVHCHGAAHLRRQVLTPRSRPHTELSPFVLNAFTLGTFFWRAM